MKHFLQEGEEGGFQLHVLSTLHRMEGRQIGFQEHVVRTLDSHSQILRSHARKITRVEGKSVKKESGAWTEVALQLWTKVIVATILLALAALTNLSPERAAQLLQGVFGK